MILNDAEKHCEKIGGRFTAPRRAVLSVIVESDKPIGAYDILKKMPGDVKPPTVYRALEFWEQEGFIHRIGSLNLYTACKAGHRHSGAQFLICDDCGNVTETHTCAVPDICTTTAEKNKFKLRGWFLELHGQCHTCQGGPEAHIGCSC